MRLLFLFLFYVIIGTACGDQEDELFISTGNPEIDSINQLLEKEQTPELYKWRGETYLEHEVYGQAISDLKKAISLDSQMVSAYLSLSEAQLKNVQPEAAQETMQEAYDRNPDDEKVALDFVKLLFTIEKNGYAGHIVQKTIEKHPRSAEAYFYLGLLLRDRGDTLKAVNALQTSVEIDPSNSEAWTVLGNIFYNAQNPLAEHYFKNAIRMNPQNYPARINYGILMAEKDSLTEAVSQFEKIPTDHQLYKQALYNRSLIYMQRQDYFEALENLNRLLQEDSSYSKAYYQKARIYNFLDSTEKEKEALLKLKELDPGHPAVQ